MLVKVSIKIAGILQFGFESRKLFMKKVYNGSYELQSKDTENVIISGSWTTNEYCKNDIINIIDEHDTFLLGYFEKNDFETLSKEDILKEVRNKFYTILKTDVSREIMLRTLRYNRNIAMVIDENSLHDIYVNKIEVTPLYLEKDEYLKGHLSMKEYMQVRQEAVDLAATKRRIT